jgi:hypothetical protein
MVAHPFGQWWLLVTRPLAAGAGIPASARVATALLALLPDVHLEPWLFLRALGSFCLFIHTPLLASLIVLHLHLTLHDGAEQETGESDTQGDDFSFSSTAFLSPRERLLNFSAPFRHD